MGNVQNCDSYASLGFEKDEGRLGRKTNFCCIVYMQLGFLDALCDH
jgi:hypothetical protein